MVLEVTAIGVAFAGTLGLTVAVDDELIRTLNTFANLITIMIVLYGPRKVKREAVAEITERIVPKVERIEERTLHLDEWDGTVKNDRRNGEDDNGTSR